MPSSSMKHWITTSLSPPLIAQRASLPRYLPVWNNQLLAISNSFLDRPTLYR